MSQTLEEKVNHIKIINGPLEECFLSLICLENHEV